MYEYKRTEFSPYELYTVGTYSSGKWQPESDHDTKEQAAARVHFLNGGASLSPYVEARTKELTKALENLIGEIITADTFHWKGYYVGRVKEASEKAKILLEANLKFDAMASGFLKNSDPTLFEQKPIDESKLFV